MYTARLSTPLYGPGKDREMARVSPISLGENHGPLHANRQPLGVALPSTFNIRWKLIETISTIPHVQKRATKKSSKNQVSFKTPWINHQHIFLQVRLGIFLKKWMEQKSMMTLVEQFSVISQKSTESTYKCRPQHGLIVVFSSFKLLVQRSLNGSLYNQPKQCTFLTKLPENTYIYICIYMFALLDPPKKREFHEPCFFSWQ